jgi:peptidoglycan/xylan/chitin deacetylase (PgdA/CDA1 family)/CelD/BcsL family acetyltransferase involved in cellulose biosynthesis
MRIVEVRTEADFAGLRESWNRLLENSGSNTIFLTWEWLFTWWSAYGNPGDLRIMQAFDENGELRGIAPLRRQEVSRYGRTYQKLTFIGDGSADSDYLDFIIKTGEERAVLELFWGRLGEHFVTGYLLELSEIPAASANFPILSELARRDRMLWTEVDVPCGVVALPEDWQEYLKQLAPRFRTKIRSVLRNLEAREDVTFGFCRTQGEVTKLLPALYDLHRRRWAKEAKPGVFGWDKKRAFYEALSSVLLERGWLSFSSVVWKDQVLACQYGFTYGNRYFQLQEGYEPASEHWNPGAGLRAWSIQQFLQQGLGEYDFMGGMGRHKSDWGGAVKLSKRVVTARPNAATAIFCKLPEWEVRARQSVKRLLPAQWIVARDARQEQERRAAFEQSSPLDGSWKRRTLSAAYYYSPLPSLLRPLRDRYRVHVSGNGTSKVRLEQRTQPSLRILYYHRVNNERDPFFPAMTTRQLEEEISYVQRRYRVLSMAEGIRRLSDGGPAEPAVVITFDDGYEDNYLHAFPILERYGIPATIFLTTGSIDSGGPLWFERLALACKTSPHPAVELELQVPRRFPLRNEKERLVAKDEIYGFLRNLTDSQRQERLEEFLGVLGGRDRGEESGRMLSWDQVRLLKSRRIDFGGHTVTHPFVSRLSRRQAVWEVAECKRRIEEELQSTVEHFAYPSGRETDFSPWNKEVIREAGYRAAVSTLWGVNHPGTDRMELRRGQPWESKRYLFAAKFDWYQWADV